MTKGGAAWPVRQVTTGTVKAGPAIRVYGYKAAPADRSSVGGAALPIKIITDADLRQNGGAYVLTGDIQAIPVYTASASSGVQAGPAIPVYVVNPSQWP
jgi:hypothetical protein